MIEESKHRGEKELIERQEKVQIEIEKCYQRVEELSEFSDLNSIIHYCKDVTQIQRRLTEIQDQINQINKEEELFKWTPTTYPQLESIHTSLDPYQRLFNTISRYITTCSCYSNLQVYNYILISLCFSDGRRQRNV